MKRSLTSAGADSSTRRWGLLVPAGLIAAVVLAAYGLSLTNSFTLDDFPFLVNNPSVTQSDSPLKVLGDASTHSTGDIVQTYRPLRTLLFALEYRVFGRRAGLLHATNLALHTLLALLLWQYGKRYISKRLALAAALVFACHPLGSEVVLSIKSQDDLLASIFVVTGLLLLPVRPGRGPRLSPCRGAWICALYALALVSKESGAILPLLVVAHFAFVMRGTEALCLRKVFPWRLALSMAVVFAAYWVLRSHALAAASPGGPKPHIPHLFLASVTCVPLYWKLFLLPIHLTVDYTWLSPVVPSALLLTGSLLLQAVVFWVVWRVGRTPGRLGLVWFYVTLLPSLNVVPGIAVTLAERFAFLPMWGLVLVLLDLCGSFLDRSPVRLSAVWRTVIVAGLVLVLSGRSAARSTDWRDNESLFRSALRANPSSEVFRVFLARELATQGRHAESEALLGELARGAVEVPVSAVSRSVLETRGLKYLAAADYGRAVEIFRANTASPYALDSDWLNYGSALTNLGRYDPAVKAFERILGNRRYAGAAHRMLGRILMEKGDFGGAVFHFDASCEVEPENALGWYFSILSRHRAGLEQEAIRRLLRARNAGISLGPLIRDDLSAWDSAAEPLRGLIGVEAAAGTASK